MYPFTPHHLPRTAQYSSLMDEKQLKNRYTPTTTKTNFYSTNYSSFNGFSTKNSEQNNINNEFLSINSQQQFPSAHRHLKSQGSEFQPPPVFPQTNVRTKSIPNIDKNAAEELYRIRKERKQNEQSLRLIKNRVNQLSKEQTHIMKSAQYTQKKTNDLINTKQQKYMKKNTQDLFRQKQMQAMVRKKDEAQHQRNTSIQKRTMQKDQRKEKLNIEYAYNKSYFQRLKDEQQDMLNEFHKRNTMSFQQAKHNEQVKRQKLKQFQQEKTNQGLLFYQKKIEQEMLRNSLSQQMILQKEQEEKQLLYRLKTSQNVRDTMIKQMKKIEQTPSDSIQVPSKMFQSAVNFRQNTQSYYVELEQQQDPVSPLNVVKDVIDQKDVNSSSKKENEQLLNSQSITTKYTEV